MRSEFFVSVDAIALVAATAKTVLQIATPSATDIRISEVWIGFDGVTSGNTPVKIEWGQFGSTAASGGTSQTPAKRNHLGAASQCTVLSGNTSEGTGAVSGQVEIHRWSPLTEGFRPYSLSSELVIPVSSWFRIRATAAQAVNLNLGVAWDE